MEKNKYPESLEVFGTKYSLSMLETPDRYMYEGNYSGYADLKEKKIIVLRGDEEERILIHELIHAHLYECGLRADSNDEHLVETFTEVFQRIRNVIGQTN